MKQRYYGLPSPRLQLEWFKTGEDWNKKECIYSLVIPLRDLDIRRENKNGAAVVNEQIIQISKTTVTGGRIPIDDGKVNPPFRDGAHAQWDSEVLNLPVYAICDNTFTKMK